MIRDDARLRLRLGRETSLRGAARVLGVDQATVGRRIGDEEVATSCSCARPTATCSRPRAKSPSVPRRAWRLQRAQSKLEGQDDALSGTVKAEEHRLHRHRRADPRDGRAARAASEHPRRPRGHCTARTSRRQGADLAIRNQKLDNLDLFVRRPASWPVGLFASEDYLARRGAGAGHRVRGARGWGRTAHRKGWFHAGRRTSRQGTVAAALNAGLIAVAAGLGLASAAVTANATGWCACGPSACAWARRVAFVIDLRNTARVRAVADFFEALKDEGCFCAGGGPWLLRLFGFLHRRRPGDGRAAFARGAFAVGQREVQRRQRGQAVAFAQHHHARAQVVAGERGHRRGRSAPRVRRSCRLCELKAPCQGMPAGVRARRC